MHISKLICIPLCIIIPVVILIFESKNRDFVTPPKPQVLQEKITNWKSNNPILNPITPVQPTSTPPKKKPTLITPKKDPNIATVPDSADSSEPLVEPQAETISNETLLSYLNVSPDLAYLRKLNKTQLLAIIRQSNSLAASSPSADLTQLIYLANERIIDSSDADIGTINYAASQLDKLNIPLWNPDSTYSATPLYVHLQLEPYHFEKAEVLKAQIESTIQRASGGMVKPTVILTKVPQEPNKNNNQITLSAKRNVSDEDVGLALNSIPNSEQMISDALKNIVTLNINTRQLPLKNTGKIHYKHFTRLTWKTLAEALAQSN